MRGFILLEKKEMSETLKAILSHWTAEFPPSENEDGVIVIEVPFDVQAFCAENDEKLRQLWLYQGSLKISPSNPAHPKSDGR